ncbi:YggS family pyridoxal phosphate-dependent enzyme [Membranihabitans maritimus]|uniref:YggS family pyridoxal phosphate-dependent enzyme n=1 Tax=Membranihabitans maritimus TaxID=2904244 RepID=UPI001F00EC4C|nr:YggS family pyridoxal phosphate-dependent enzyme [Membranihabitans maritimus]
MNYSEIKESLSEKKVELVAVSKTHGVDKIKKLYDSGQRIFGENKVQELIEKKDLLPQDIQWHMIGHLQSNKVKYIAPFISLIHSLDRLKLAKEINKEARKNDRIIPCLLQVRIAKEDTKFGVPPSDIHSFMQKYKERNYSFIKIAGVMGMATFTKDIAQIKAEFDQLTTIFETIKKEHFPGNEDFRIKSMGMSGDYKLAIECGSNMVRIGSLIFGSRNY